MTDPSPSYRYGGARALVALHDHHLRSFLDTWKRAQRARISLPDTDDPSYASREHLLHHVLRAARGYMTWMCERLDLPDPGIEPAPEPPVVEAEADAYLEHLLARWRTPLAGIEEQRFDEVYPSRWGVPHAVESMLEHAVVHPIRHQFQLENLMREQSA